MFADQLLDFFGIRHLWQQLQPFGDKTYVRQDDLITRAQIDSLFADNASSDGDNGGED